MAPLSDFGIDYSDMVHIVDEVPGQDVTVPENSLPLSAVIYLSVFFTLLVMSFMMMCLKISALGQKTRTPPQRRMYVGTRPRQSLSQAEPTIYVSPNNLPPPPKYECLAPPSYEEVVGIHYPQYQSQPITQPITAAMAQNAQSSQNATDAPPPTVITITSERPSVQVASS